MVLLEFSMSPLDKGESVSEYVSRSLEIISESGVDYRLNPMGTVLEGEWDEVMDVVKLCYESVRRLFHRDERIAVLHQGCPRSSSRPHGPIGGDEGKE